MCPVLTPQDSWAAGKEGGGGAGGAGASCGQGRWGLALTAQSIPIRDRDMESCNGELIFDHVGHFGK